MMNGRGHTLLTVASDSMAVKSGDWTSEGPSLYKACGTLGHNDPFVVALLKGRVPQQTLWPISNPFTKPHTVRDHRRECKKHPQNAPRSRVIWFHVVPEFLATGGR